MISFICCTESHSLELKESVRASMDDKWELVVQGSAGGIGAAYNRGAIEASGDVLAFVHADVQLLFNALVWDEIEARVRDPQTGFVGVAGTAQLESHGCWWDTTDKRKMRGAVLHDHAGSMDAFAGAGSLPLYLSSWPPTGAAYFGRCVVLDGVFLVARRNVFDRLGGFDETLTGFDFYDIDVTLRAHLSGLQNWALPVPLRHRAGRVMGDGFAAARRQFVAKHGNSLPAKI